MPATQKRRIKSAKRAFWNATWLTHGISEEPLSGRLGWFGLNSSTYTCHGPRAVKHGLPPMIFKMTRPPVLRAIITIIVCLFVEDWMVNICSTTKRLLFRTITGIWSGRLRAIPSMAHSISHTPAFKRYFNSKEGFSTDWFCLISQY